MITAWNTGARYTQYGQRIAAKVCKDAQGFYVAFYDIDRDIWGSFRLERNLHSTFTLKDLTMTNYLCGNYSMFHDVTLQRELHAVASFARGDGKVVDYK